MTQIFLTFQIVGGIFLAYRTTDGQLRQHGQLFWEGSSVSTNTIDFTSVMMVIELT